MTPLLLTMREVAAETGLSESTVRRLAREGHLPVVRVSRRTMIARARLEEWLATSTGDLRARTYAGAELAKSKPSLHLIEGS